uniref:DNA-directed DNA polymerase n=1 Tax=Caldisericum exile TaxID=693075 RepID=A0A7C4XU16_9BACT
MRECSAIELLSELDNALPEEGLILLLGEQNYLKEQIEKKFEEKIFKDNPNSIDYIKLAPPFTVDEFLNTISTPPFFSTKLVIVKDGENMTKPLLQKILSFSIPSFTKVLVITNEKDIQTLKGDFIVVRDYTVPLNKVEKWIEKKGRENGKSISNEAIKELIRRLDTNFYALSTEIKKLSSYVGGRNEISKEDVVSIVREIPEEDIFDFVNAVLFERKNDAMKMLQYFLGSTNQENLILFQMLRTISIYLIVNDLKNKEGMTLKEINAFIEQIFHIYIKKSTLEEAIKNIEKLNIQSLVKHYNMLVNIDAKSKTGEMNLPLALRDYILSEFS